MGLSLTGPRLARFPILASVDIGMEIASIDDEIPFPRSQGHAERLDSMKDAWPGVQDRENGVPVNTAA